MNPTRYVFYAAVLMATAFGVMLINNLPTVFDLITVSVGTVGGVAVGRKSNAWF